MIKNNLSERYLCRGKRIDNNEWIEGYYVKSTHTYGLVVNPSYKIEHQIWYDKDNKQVYAEVDPETVGQFTGLTDENGKKIFEKDIVELTYWFLSIERKVATQVVYEEERAAFILYPCKEKDGGIYIESFYTKKVIGNLFDNSELLQEGK